MSEAQIIICFSIWFVLSIGFGYFFSDFIDWMLRTLRRKL